MGSKRWPEIVDMATLEAWIRSRGFEPDEYAEWDYETQGPPPWAESEWVGDGWTYHWPLMNTERRVMGTITLDTPS